MPETLTLTDEEIHDGWQMAQLGILGAPSGSRDKALRLVNKGWRVTYATLYGQSFVDSLDSVETEDQHHSEAISWHWNARIALLKGQTPPNGEYAYFPIWARGNMKSSIAEAMVVVDAFLSYAYKQTGYCLYIGREKDRVRENIGNLEALLSRKAVREYAPELSEVARNEETNQKRQWTGSFLHTKAGFIIKGGTIDSAQAGSRIKHLSDELERDTRITFFVPDDIDSREDSPVIAESRFNKLTNEILPMGQENTLTFFAQNLISRYSVMYRIQKGSARVLTNRKPTQPIPAVRGLVTETQTIHGIVKDVVVAGKPTWRVWDLNRVQKEIDTMGLPAFLRECHPAGTRVRLGWHDNVPIEQVRVGDHVLTHRNRRRRVTELIRQEYSGDLYSIKIANASVPIKSTANHLFFACIPPVSWRWQGKKKNPGNLRLQWCEASDLAKGAYLVEPIPEEPPLAQDGLVVWEFIPTLKGRTAKGNRTIRATAALFRLLGYYLAEGRADSYVVSFTFHEKEQEYIQDVIHLFKEVFGVKATTRPDNGHAIRVECPSIIAATFFRDVGVGSHFKRVPDWAFAASNRLLKELIIGYWRGDGCKDPSGFAYNTVSEQLAEHIRLILLRLGIVSGLYRLKERDVSLPQGTLYRRSCHWQGDINGKYAAKLGVLLGIPHKTTSTRSSCFIHNGYLWKPIRNIKREAVADFPVYNFEVEDDASYIAENIASHNCQHEVEQSKEGLIIYNYEDGVHPVSFSQFESVYGSRDAWKDWYKVLFNDYARTKTKFHANVGGYLSVSSQNTKLPGHTFLVPMSFKANTPPEDMACRFLSALQPFAYETTTWSALVEDAWKRLNPAQHFDSVLERVNYLSSVYARIIPQYAKPVLSGFNVRASVMSHSEDKLRESFNSGFGFGFQPSNPGKNDAIEDINAAMKVDFNLAHCFDVEKKGYTRFHVLCPDDTTKEPQIVNGVAVYPPREYVEELSSDHLHDSDLFRFQMLNCRNREPKLTETGEIVDEPLKLHDDFKQGLQMVYFKKLLLQQRFTPVEKFEHEMAAKGLTELQIQELDNERERLDLLQVRTIEQRAFDNKQKKKSNGSYMRVGPPRR